MKKAFIKSTSIILVLMTILASMSGLGISAEEADLSFDCASVRSDKGIVVYFIVEKAKLSGYDSFFMSYSKDGGAAVNVEAYDEINGNYYFACNDIAAKEMGDKISATLTATKDGQSKTGEALEYSVSDYCYDILNDESSEQWEKQLAASMLLYGAEAQKYFDYKEDALVTATMTDAQKAMALSVDKAAITSVYENQPKDSSVAITGATIEHSASPRLVVQLVENGEEEALAGLSVNFAWNGGNATIEGNELKSIDGKLYAYLNGISVSRMSEVITITAFRGRAPVSNTVKYSLASYMAEKKDDAEASAIALALYSYSKAITDMPAEVSCQFGHTNISEADIDDSYNLTVHTKCTVCGETKTVTGKGYSSTQLHNMSSKRNNYDATATYTSSYDSVQNAWKQTFSSGGSDAYFMIKNLADSGEAEAGNKHIPYNGSPYVVVRVKGSGTIKIKPTKGDEATVTLTNEWQNVVIHAKNTSSYDYMRSMKFYLSGKGATVYVNSIAVFESKSDAEIYAGAFGHTYEAETSIDAEKNLSITSVCSVCGSTKTVNAKGVDANMMTATTPGTTLYSIKKDEAKNEIQLRNNGTFSDTGTNYIMLATGLTLDGGNKAKYLVIYMSSTCDVKVRPAWGDAQLNTLFTASETMTAWIIDVSSITKNSLTLRLDPQKHTPGTTITVNSVAIFETLDDAKAFAGVGLE